MKRRLALAWLGLIALPAWPAPAAPAALFAHCPGGAPQQDLLGRTLTAGFWRDGPILAIFWSVDCGFCRRHNAKLDQLLHEPGLTPARVVGVLVDDPAVTLPQTIWQRGYGFPVILDGSGGCSLRAQLTPRLRVPMSCWLGPAPTQPRCIPGEMADDDLRNLLRHALPH